MSASMPDRHRPAPPSDDRQLAVGQAVELERVVPPSGNLWVSGQQIWLGPAMTDRTIRLWAGLDRVLDGCRIKTVPARLDHRNLARLAAAGAAPAGPPPLGLERLDLLQCRAVEQRLDLVPLDIGGHFPVCRSLPAGSGGLKGWPEEAHVA